MIKGRIPQATNNLKDGPYRRVGILVLISVVIIVLLFGINAIAKGLGGDERRLAEAVIATMQKPYINGSLDLSHQAQMSAVSIQSDIKFANGKALQADSTIKLGEDAGEKVEIPLNIRADFSKPSAYYINASSLDKIAKPLGSTIPELNADLLSVADKIDGKWLKYEPAQGASDGCTFEIMRKIQSDEAAVKEVTRTYMSHRFIDVSSVDKKNKTTQVYKVELDSQELTNFSNGLYEAKFVKKIAACKDAVAQAKAATAQASQQKQPKNKSAPQNPTATITVKDKLVVDVTSSQAAQSGASTVSLALDFGKNSITMPSENIIDADAVKHEAEAIGKFIIEQQASQQQNQQQPGAGAMGGANAGGPVIQPR